MTNDCFSQIAHLSRAFTLEPGDVIATGTPAGVGIAMDPPRFQAVGDVVRVEIDGLGAIANSIADEPGEGLLEHPRGDTETVNR